MYKIYAYKQNINKNKKWKIKINKILDLADILIINKNYKQSNK
jgi:hypothetical protein